MVDGTEAADEELAQIVSPVRCGHLDAALDMHPREER